MSCIVKCHYPVFTSIVLFFDMIVISNEAQCGVTKYETVDLLAHILVQGIMFATNIRLTRRNFHKSKRDPNISISI
jgi:hypothetical protein